MAMASGTHFHVFTGGSDTINSGGFNKTNANLISNGSLTVANTNAPVLSSASYNFVAGDVGHWVYIKSGTGSIPGFYKIASVAANAATLTAGVGTATLDTGFLNTVVGCNSSASPTSQTFGIDYSRGQTTPKQTYTDLTVGVTTSQLTSSGHPLAINLLGNIIVLSSTVSGTPTLSRYELVSISGTTITCDRSCGTAGGVANGAVGGSLATPGGAQAARIGAGGGGATGMPVIIWDNGTYTNTSTSSNVANGILNDSGNGFNTLYPYSFEGCHAVPGDGRQVPPAGTPVISAGATTSVTMLTMPNTSSCYNLTFDCNNGTSNAGVTNGNAYKINVKNAKGVGFNNCLCQFCTATGCSGAAAYSLTSAPGSAFYCEAYSNTTVGFLLSGNQTFAYCLSYGNTGTSSYGFNCGGQCNVINCTAYSNGSHGFFDNVGAHSGLWINCIAEANGTGASGGNGYNVNANNVGRKLINCAAYNNVSGNFNANVLYQEGSITGSGTFFNNAAGNDFSLNTKVNQGALCINTGYPGPFPHASSTSYTDIGAIQTKTLPPFPVIRQVDRPRQAQYVRRNVPLVISGGTVTNNIPVPFPVNRTRIVTTERRVVRNRYVPLQPTTFQSVPVHIPNKQVRTLVANRIIKQVPIQVGIPVPIRTPPKQVRTVQTVQRTKYVPIQPTTFRPIPVRIPNRVIRVLAATNHIKPVVIPVPVPGTIIRTPAKHTRDTLIQHKFRTRIIAGNTVVIPRTSVRRTVERVTQQPRNVTVVLPTPIIHNVIVSRPILVR